MVNSVSVVGRLTQAPELRTAGNSSVCSFTVACDRGYKNKDGNYDADFIPVVIWRSGAEFVTKYFTKGSMIGVVGKLQTRKFTDKNGNNRNIMEVIASEVSFVGSKERNTSSVENAAESEFNSIDGESEDLPF